MSKFRPQMTTHNSFKVIESDLFNSLVKTGLTEDLARAVAHGLTLFRLGYITPEGVAKTILDAGADEETARNLALLIIDPDLGPRKKIVNG